jgi:hypothetical protein
MLSQTPNTSKLPRRLLIVGLQVVLLVLLVGAGWFIYRRLPASSDDLRSAQGRTTVQIFIRQTPESAGPALDVVVNLYPVDIIAVRHEFFTEPRAGKRFEDFLKERMGWISRDRARWSCRKVVGGCARRFPVMSNSSGACRSRSLGPNRLSNSRRRMRTREARLFSHKKAHKDKKKAA